MITQSSIPEVKEDAVGYALNERKQKLSQFIDLGPPDLITLVKYSASSSNQTTNNNNNNTTTSGSKSATGSNGEVDTETVDPTVMLTELHSHDKLKGEIGTFFYSLGCDTSDPTSITIFLKQITDVIVEQPQVWFGKKKNFQIARISLSTWNTFRKCDMNIVVHIPGTVQLFILDSNGEQINVKPNTQESKLIWAETFISGVVRSMMLMKDNYEDGEIQNLVETLIINPMASGEIDSVTDTFIDLFPLVYANGDLLGGPVTVINASRTNNYLVETLIELVTLTHSVDKCREMLELLMQVYPEVIVILIRILLNNDYEIEAMELLNHQLMEIEKFNDPELEHVNDGNNIFPQDYRSELLCIQVEFLIDIKKDFKLAQILAQDAVNCGPSEFKPWYLLSKSYIRLNDIENALLSLNACPMASLKEKYILKRVIPFQSDSSLHLPLPVDAVLDDVTSLNPQDIQQEHKNADPALTNLAASSLKSTFQVAYKLLTDIVQITGWETLLKIRSKLFVMEDEYQSSSEEVYNNNNNKSNIAIKSDTGSIDTTMSTLRVKRLCERWLDNLFMLLYEDLKTYTLWQGEQVYFEAQNSTYNKLTFEWELYGLCARRLGHYPEAAKAFENGLSQRFSSLAAKKLLEYYINERTRVRQLSNLVNCNMTSGQIMTRINELDSMIIDLIVKICCWNHRWYIEFSRQLIIFTGVVIEDLGITKVSNEIAARYPESVSKLINNNLLDFFTKYTNEYYDV